MSAAASTGRPRDRIQAGASSQATRRHHPRDHAAADAPPTVAETNGLRFPAGRNGAPAAFAFMDPKRPCRAQAIRTAEPEPVDSALQLRAALAPVISLDSFGLIAAILRDPDPTETFLRHECGAHALRRHVRTRPRQLQDHEKARSHGHVLPRLAHGRRRTGILRHARSRRRCAAARPGPSASPGPLTPGRSIPPKNESVTSPSSSMPHARAFSAP